MIFCPKCKSIMRPADSNGVRVMSCTCGFSTKKTEITLVESVKKEKKLEVVSDDQELDTLPITKAECPKCGNLKAYYWLVQTRAADEPETKFLKCTKCKHTYRDYN